ncbi:MAG: integrase core domain-containing protein, partial [Clostridia bacterium]|nr:integrase core domain-containing protein [Clostridia bacterium]
LHSDQGVQYSSAGYTNLLKEYHVIQSMSRAGTPKDNAVIESFFGKFKDILKSRKFCKADNLKSVIDQTIYYYNYIKPMRKLNGKPPVQFRIEQAA